MKLFEYQKQGISLESLSLQVLQGIDVENPAEEKIIQELVNKKLKIAPVQVEINRANDKTDFRSPAEEAEFQKVINERVASARPMDEPKVVASENELENKIEELKEEKAKLDRFCEFCTSKGVRHLKTCIRNKTKNT